jgi:competence protein ComEA
MNIYSSLITTLLVSVLSTPALAANQPIIKSALLTQPFRSETPLMVLTQKGVKASVNINTSDAETLVLELNGIGQKRAQAIIAYRKQHGPFKSIEDLINVKGIGKKILERNRGKIIV